MARSPWSVSVAVRSGLRTGHVIDAYRRRIRDGKRLTCQIGNAPINPMDRLVSEDKDLDLAVLGLTGVSPSEIRGGSDMPCQFYEPRAWPPVLPAKGDFVLFGGFPKSRRVRLGPNHYEFGSASSGGTEVHSVGVDIIHCRIQIDLCVVSFDLDGKGFGPLPGISGSPVMVARQLPSNVTVFDLVGIVFEYNEELDLLRVRPTTLLMADGMIEASQ